MAPQSKSEADSTSEATSEAPSSNAIPRDDIDPVDIQPAEIFRTYVATNSEVCKHCLLRLKRTVPYPWEQGYRYRTKKGLLAFVQKHVPENADWEIAESYYSEQESLPQRIESGNPGDKHVPCQACDGRGYQTDSHETRQGSRYSNWSICERCNGDGSRWKHGHGSYCKHCGTFDFHEPPTETRSRTEAKTAAFNLSMTLSEFGIAHNFVELVERIDEYKGDPETAGNDFQCYKLGVADAVRDARNTGADS